MMIAKSPLFAKYQSLTTAEVGLRRKRGVRGEIELNGRKKRVGKRKRISNCGRKEEKEGNARAKERIKKEIRTEAKKERRSDRKKEIRKERRN